MDKSKIQTLKGFRDFLPEQANAREFVIGKIKETFKSFGFEPLETPALEYEEVLAGKYGEEGDKLMYRFTDNGDRRVAMRYDQTVPLARVIAQYPELPKPFKRYQIQPVWRAENTQKGRYREFLQCDVDIVGTNSVLADAETIQVAIKALENLGIENFKILINDRSIFYEFEKFNIRPIDKLKKIGEEAVLAEMIEAGADKTWAKNTLDYIKTATKTSYINRLFKILEEFGLTENRNFVFEPTLMRGLDYYTGLVFEIIIPEYGEDKSVGGGGRYDKLIGLYSGQDQPAVGFAFGFDRLMEAMEELNLLPKNTFSAKVLVTVFNSDLMEKSLEVAALLRSKDINTELWLEPDSKLDKQLKYADQKGIPFAIIIGPDEAESGKVTLKNLLEKTQETLTLEEIIPILL